MLKNNNGNDIKCNHCNTYIARKVDQPTEEEIESGKRVAFHKGKKIIYECCEINYCNWCGRKLDKRYYYWCYDESYFEGLPHHLPLPNINRR